MYVRNANTLEMFQRIFGFHYDRRNDCYRSNCTQLICRILSRVWQTLDRNGITGGQQIRCAVHVCTYRILSAVGQQMSVTRRPRALLHGTSIKSLSKVVATIYRHMHASN